MQGRLFDRWLFTGGMALAVADGVFLFLGVILGKAFAGVHAAIAPEHALSPVVAAVVGMSGLAVAVVGGPLT
ncbi:MAG TPA: hypothetical protein PLX20_07290, partial [Rhodocyclaceae bacterium]|nr:hypothetical protein [Rhodocyclaceae bacterium]